MPPCSSWRSNSADSAPDSSDFWGNSTTDDEDDECESSFRAEKPAKTRHDISAR